MHLPPTAPSIPPDPSGRLSIEQLLESQPILSKQVLIVCLCFAVAAFDGLDLAIMGFIAPALRGEWHLLPPQLGALFSAGLIGLAIGALTAGPAADRLGRKRVLVLAVSVFGSMCVASAFARNPHELLVLRILTGLGLGAAAPNAITLTSEYTPPRKRSSMVTTMFCGFNLGSALGGLVIVPLLLPHIGWRGILMFIGLLPVILVPFLALLLPESLKYLATRVGDRPKMDAILRRVFPGFQGDSQSIVIAPETKRESSAVSGLFTEKLRGCTFLLWPVFFMNLLVIYLISNWLPTVIKDSGFSTTMASVIVSSFQIGGMLGSFSIGYFMDRRRPESVILCVYLLGALSTAALGFAYFSPALLAVCIFVVGITVSGGMTGIIALTSQIYPTASRATGVSWAMGIGRVGSIVGSTVGAWLFSSMFTFQTAFLLVAAPSIFIALGIVLLGRLRAALAAQAAQEFPTSPGFGGQASANASVGLIAPLVGLGLIVFGASTVQAQSTSASSNPAPAVQPATGTRDATVTAVTNSPIAGPLVIPFTLLRAPAGALYTLAHEDEDFRYLADPTKHNDLFDATRYIPLGLGGPQFFLSLGADLRATYEITNNDGFGTRAYDQDGFTFIRLLGYADLHLGEHFRIFGELIYSDESGRDGGPSPVQRDDGDLDQAFAEVAFNLGKPDGPMPAPVNVAGGLVDPKQNSVSLRVGRQEVAFGDERLFSIREGTSLRFTYDAIRATLRLKPFQLDLFGGRLDANNQGTFDNDPSDIETYVWGAYLTTFAVDKKPLFTKDLRLTANLDLYYFGTYNDSTVFNYNEGAHFDHRNTVGGRVWGRFDLGNTDNAPPPLTQAADGSRTQAVDPKDGHKSMTAPAPRKTPDTIDYNIDGAYQFGKFGDATDISAFMAAFDAGYTFQGIKPRPRLGFEFQITSGDKNKGDGENNTFNSLFESGNRYGALYDNQQFGPANSILLRPELSFDVTSKLQVALMYLLDWRESLSDGVYGIPNSPVRAPSETNRDRFVTHAPEIRVRYSFDRHTTLTLDYSRFNAGSFIENSAPIGKSVDTFAAAIQIKF